jgi:hypothetical protein
VGDVTDAVALAEPDAESLGGHDLHRTTALFQDGAGELFGGCVRIEFPVRYTSNQRCEVVLGGRLADAFEENLAGDAENLVAGVLLAVLLQEA